MTANRYYVRKLVGVDIRYSVIDSEYDRIILFARTEAFADQAAKNLNEGVWS